MTVNGNADGATQNANAMSFEEAPPPEPVEAPAPKKRASRRKKD